MSENLILELDACLARAIDIATWMGEAVDQVDPEAEVTVAGQPATLALATMSPAICGIRMHLQSITSVMGRPPRNAEEDHFQRVMNDIVGRMAELKAKEEHEAEAHVCEVCEACSSGDALEVPDDILRFMHKFAEQMGLPSDKVRIVTAEIGPEGLSVKNTRTLDSARRA